MAKKQINVSSTFHKMVFCAKVERMVTQEVGTCMQIISDVENLKRELAEQRWEEQQYKREYRQAQREKLA